MSIASFVRDLSEYSREAVFNPYADICGDHDRVNAPAVRRRNLRLMLEAAQSAQVNAIWVARDLGYRGGRRTGLALTDEAHLAAVEALLHLDGLQKATKGAVVAERTATVVWDMLTRVGRPVMLWNVFPFHPHASDDPMTNRSHTRREREETLPFLLALIDLLRPSKLIAIGRDSADALSDIGLPVVCVRHPSYGGQADFIAQLEIAYGLASRRPEQFKLPLLAD
ncbi:MAG TPA: uracil-DNA glycosylase [Hyphomonadaceae bacterium]|nr:uracil-DNA glycosylase [Hyphomonadaceae bacterium]